MFTAVAALIKMIYFKHLCFDRGVTSFFIDAAVERLCSTQTEV